MPFGTILLPAILKLVGTGYRLRIGISLPLPYLPFVRFDGIVLSHYDLDGVVVASQPILAVQLMVQRTQALHSRPALVNFKVKLNLL